MTKKFGGVRLTFQRVRSETCAGCGKPFDLCVADWEAKLKITGHTSDTSNSAYKDNVNKIRAAIVEGLDPFCMRANLSYTSVWTPHMPLGSFDPVQKPYRKRSVDVSAKTSEVTLGSTKSGRTQRGLGRRRNPGGGGR